MALDYNSLPLGLSFRTPKDDCCQVCSAFWGYPCYLIDKKTISVLAPTKGSVLYPPISSVFCQVLFGICLLVHVPNLNPYVGYTPMQSDSLENTKYEVLPGGDQICPEKHANMFSKPGRKPNSFLFPVSSTPGNLPVTVFHSGHLPHLPILSGQSERR
ncbi:ABC transporter C family member 1 [Vitis vinifera]|uniref:ABC transporter C family member 1 n=1 Tax=Vitis vinifera TaxID=29760 RepID=A0A438IP99_VITVI|nr:ABC transporter C family member 1 [Vitis vinifera]